MRIIGGTHRSRIIIYPTNEDKVRPTKDRVREAVFSILQYQIVDKDVLDIFAGSGAYGLESMSRGAKSVTFIDSYPDSIRCIKENIKNLNITNCTVIENDFLPALEKLGRENKQYDIIFMDPPYKAHYYYEIVDLLIKREMLKENAILILESDHVLDINKFNNFKIKQYEYGKNYITILRK